MRGALGDRDPLNKVPASESHKSVEKDPFLGVSLKTT